MKKDKEVVLDDTNLGSAQCEYCAHYIGNRKCKAYPNGIPIEIWQLWVDHKKPYNGDGGITYKPESKEHTEVMCPLTDEMLGSGICAMIVGISEGLISESYLADSFKEKENWREICEHCENRKYADDEA